MSTPPELPPLLPGSLRGCRCPGGSDRRRRCSCALFRRRNGLDEASRSGKSELIAAFSGHEDAIEM